MNCKQFDWITINFSTLEIELLNENLSEEEKAQRFSFESKIKRLKQRQLESEYIVNVIIKTMNS